MPDFSSLRIADGLAETLMILKSNVPGSQYIFSGESDQSDLKADLKEMAFSQFRNRVFNCQFYVLL